MRMKLATLRPGIAVGYWKARKSPSRARLSGRELEDVAALPDDLAALDDVGRVAHQRVGEGRLARAVGAHDRVDLALADGQVDPLEDLVLGLAMGATRRPRMMSCWSVRSVTGGQAPWTVCRLDGARAIRGGTRSARVIESRAPATASRTRTHRTLTVQRDDDRTGWRARDRRWRTASARSGPRARAGPRPSRSSRGRGRARSRHARRACS